MRLHDDAAYSLSCDNWGDGKSICLWRTSKEKAEAIKIARFQSDYAAKLFAEEFGFPLSEKLKIRLRAIP